MQASDGRRRSPVDMSEARRPVDRRVLARRLRRAGRFLLTWGTPVAIGVLLGSAATHKYGRERVQQASDASAIAPP